MCQFSIVTVCKNDLRGLEATHHSIIAQTCHSIEWIVIDAQSSDGTRGWLENISRRDTRWISEPDEGIYDAMNKGLAMARGQYILFLDSADTLVDENILLTIIGAIDENNPPFFLYGDRIKQRGRNWYYKAARPHDSLALGMFTEHQAMFFMRDKINGLSFDRQFRIAGDYAFVAQFLRDIPETRICYLPMAICRFQLGGIHESMIFRKVYEDWAIQKLILKCNPISRFCICSIRFMSQYARKALRLLFGPIGYVRGKG